MKKTNINASSVGVENFEWPEFATDKKRIQAYTRRYNDYSIIDAFSKHYSVDIDNVNEVANIIPVQPTVGSIIKAKIISIGKNKVTFSQINTKANIQSGINLFKYNKFKNNIPDEEIEALVTRVDKDRVIVDPISPMISKWLDPILKDPTIQKVMPEGGVGDISQKIYVKDLRLSRGGFVGKAVIPNVSKFVGEDYTIDAFIPGSQIVLNIAENFNEFEGKTVETFVANYIKHPGTKSGMSLVCSAKEVLKFKGECNMISIFNSWCEESDIWNSVANNTYVGKVTGVINTSKKCGVFIEIPSLCITGMVSTKPEELVNYKPHSQVLVKLDGFDEEMVYNYDMQQMQHVMPYEIEETGSGQVLRKCNLKPILKFA